MPRLRQAHTAQANQIRGLLAEYGLIVPQGIAHITSRVPDLIEDATNELPGTFRLLIDQLIDHLKLLVGRWTRLKRKSRPGIATTRSAADLNG